MQNGIGSENHTRIPQAIIVETVNCNSDPNIHAQEYYIEYDQSHKDDAHVKARQE